MIDFIDQIDVSSFHKDYVQKRRPCILTNIPDDLACLSACADLEVLAAHTGHVDIAVEPVSDKGTFGTAATKISMTVRAFLKRLQAGEKIYLTTQYSEAEEAAILNEPLISLRKSLHVPIIPDLAGKLVPAKINLWLGASQEGTSSGLHHDFHDNFYILLSGQKRFRIFKPSWKACQQLKVHGTPHEIFANGLISYGNSLCSDGLTSIMKAQLRTDVCEDLLHQARASGLGLEEAESRYEEAMDNLLQCKLENCEESEDGDFESGDESEASTGGDHIGEADSGEDDVGSEDKGEAFPGIEHLPEFNADQEIQISEDPDGDESLNASTSASVSDDPPSFSRLSNQEVTEMLESEVLEGSEFVLEAGQMLYLPASYFHEVISTSKGHDYHMAINYWFFPPDDESDTYADKEIMDQLRSRVLHDYPVETPRARKKVKF